MYAIMQKKRGEKSFGLYVLLARIDQFQCRTAKNTQESEKIETHEGLVSMKKEWLMAQENIHERCAIIDSNRNSCGRFDGRACIID